ncbi:MAG: ATP-binding protein [Saprospiraceae bacterium]
MSFIKSLIPIKIQADRKIFRSVYSLIVVDLIILLISLSFVPIFLFIDFEEGAYIMFYSSLAALGYILLLNLNQNLTTSGNYFVSQIIIICISMMYFTGGVTSPFLFWLFCTCPVLFLFFKEKVAFIWTGIILICFLTLAILQILGYSFEQQLTPIVLIITWSASFLFGVFIFVSTFKNFQLGLKKINKKLKGTNSELKNSNQELERFAYIASHDLKSPLRSVISFITLFNKRYKSQIDEDGQEFLDIIATNADQMQHLIEDILEYSKSKNRVLKKEKVDLNKVLKQIVSHINSNDFYLDGKVQVSPLPIIESDFTIFKQLFQNLIDNGLKYNHGHHKLVSVQYLEKETELYFLIKDNGIGMEEAYFEKIFEMFQRLHNKSEYQGTGIGLAVCKKIIQNLGGKIWVSSKLGEGSIFHITFPKSMLWSEKKIADVKDKSLLGIEL